MSAPLYRTTLVIWSDFEPSELSPEDLGREAVSGEAYCSAQDSILVEDPTSDPQWDGTEFFEAGSL